MTGDLSVFLVFFAGILSFLSPCVLPLIPSYLSILGGVGFDEKPRLTFTAFGFILGFSAVFITLGILVSTTFSLMGGISIYINWAAGIIVIVLGLNIIFDFISFLNYEKRPFLNAIHRDAIHRNTLPGVFKAFAAGAAFGAGWTPCIGPILTAILLMAGQSGKTAPAVFYLAVYSSGLAFPFILAAVFFDSFLKRISGLRAHLPLIKKISGVLLICIGILILTGRYSALNILIQKSIFSYINWAETKALPFRYLANVLKWIQGF